MILRGSRGFNADYYRGLNIITDAILEVPFYKYGNYEGPCTS